MLILEQRPAVKHLLKADIVLMLLSVLPHLCSRCSGAEALRRCHIGIHSQRGDDFAARQGICGALAHALCPMLCLPT